MRWQLPMTREQHWRLLLLRYFHMQGILDAMIDYFDSRWGDGEDINEYTLGRNGTNKGQPCGYTKGQVLCFTLDPRMVTLPQVPEEQEEAV